MDQNEKNPLALFMKDIRQYNRLPKSKEIELANKYQKEGDLDALHELVTSNLSLVIWLSKRMSAWGNSSLNASEIISIGCEYLFKAAMAWKPNGDAAFAAFAKHFIERGISRSGDKEDRIIMLPLNVSEKIRKMRFQERKLLQKFGRKPKISELSEATGFTEAKINDLQQVLIRQPISLDAITTQKESDDETN